MAGAREREKVGRKWIEDSIRMRQKERKDKDKKIEVQTAIF